MLEFLRGIVWLAFFGVACFLIINSSFSRVKEDLESTTNKALEEAYYKGQIDALEGDIRVAKDSSGNFIRTKSVWDDDLVPL